MTPLGQIDQRGNQLEQGLYIHQKSRRAALVKGVHGNSCSIKYFPGSDGRRIPARDLMPFSPEITSYFLQQQDFLIWVNNQIRGNPDLEKAVRKSLEYKTKLT